MLVGFLVCQRERESGTNSGVVRLLILVHWYVQLSPYVLLPDCLQSPKYWGAGLTLPLHPKEDEWDKIPCRLLPSPESPKNWGAPCNRGA